MNALSIITYLNRIQKQLSGHLLAQDPHTQYHQVRFFPTRAGFPTNGTDDKLYIDESSGAIYAWNGTQYNLFSSSASAILGTSGVSVVYDINTQVAMVTNTDRGSSAVETHLQTSNPHPEYANQNAFNRLFGNTGEVVSGSPTDSVAVIGSGGITTLAAASPNRIVITPTYGVPVALGSSEFAGNQNQFARADHIHTDPVIAHVAAQDPHVQYILNSQKGATNGVAPLGNDAKIPAVYLPSYVEQVVEYPGISSFPDIGSTSKIYVDIWTNRT